MNSLHKKIVYILQKEFFHYVQINEEELSKIDNDEANYLIKRSKVSLRRKGVFCQRLLELGVIKFIEIPKPVIDRSKTKQERYKIKKKESGKVITSFYISSSLKDDFSFLCKIVYPHQSVGSVIARLMREDIKKNTALLKEFSHLRS